MASAFTHAYAALAIGAAARRLSGAGRLWAAGIASAILPDADVIGFSFGVRYDAPWGHRGLSHSLAFAALWSALLTGIFFRDPAPLRSRRAVWLYLFAATSSHGLLDALTNGGLGVALLSPFDSRRIFFPFRPIRVSPIGVAEFFSPEGLAILGSELVWVWLPAGLLAAAVTLVRRRRRPLAG
ncbi:MAG: metal-dependent hydrolase [Thermoanaerobaculia bacterium]